MGAIAQRRLRATASRSWLAAGTFLLPAVVILAIFRVWPLLDVFRLSLTHWDGFTAPRYIGFDNFTALWHDPTARHALWHNVLLLVVTVPTLLVVPYLIASAIHSRVWGWRFIRIACFLPAVLSPAILGVFFGLLLSYDGPPNAILRGIGLDGLAHEWLTDPTTALWVVAAIVVYWSFGVGVLFFLAGFGNVEPNLIDAAKLDGASWLTTQRHVVIPSILPVVEFWVVVCTISTFNGIFPLIYTLTRGGPGDSTMTLDMYLYQTGFGQASFGMASALGVVILVAVSLVVIPQIVLFRRRSEW